jgi:hypothetical protein
LAFHLFPFFLYPNYLSIKLARDPGFGGFPLISFMVLPYLAANTLYSP